jgi:ADP-ribosylglycohydrolase
MNPAQETDSSTGRIFSQESALMGCMLGTAIGDALGLPAEGLTPQRILRRWGSGPQEMRLIFGSGMASDDTEHTYAVAQALASFPADVAGFQRALANRLRW